MNIIFRAVLAAAFAVPAAADSFVRQRAESGGYRGMGAFESSTSRKVQGVKAREEGTFKFTGAVLGRLGKKKPGTVDIMRVDLDKRWALDLKKKTYTEGPITPVKGEKGEDSVSEAPAEAKDAKPTHRIKKTSFEVKTSEERKEINGFDTQKHEVSFIMEVEELATKDVTTYKMLSDQWLTPWTKTLRAVAAEELKFAQAYLKKLGVDATAQDRAAMGVAQLQMLTRAGGPELEKSLGDMKKKTAKLDGYAIRTETRWLTEPPKGAAPEEKPRMEEVEDDEPLEVTGGIGGLLGGLAKKAAKKKVKKMAAEHVAAQDGKPAFTSTTEILEVSDEPISAGEFEIPEGYKKKG